MVWYPYQSRSITPTPPNDDAMPEVSRVRIETCRVRAAPVNRLSDATQMQDVTDDDESDFAARKEWRATSDCKRPLPSSLSLMMTRQQVLSSRSSGRVKAWDAEKICNAGS
jgi:hypothetical protein